MLRNAKRGDRVVFAEEYGLILEGELATVLSTLRDNRGRTLVEIETDDQLWTLLSPRYLERAP
jgi:hypothetical protein